MTQFSALNGLNWTIFVLATFGTAIAIAVLALRNQKKGDSGSEFVKKQLNPLGGTVLALVFAIWVLSLAAGIDAAVKDKAESDATMA